MPFWKAGKNDDQVLDDIKETQKQNADEFVKEQAHTQDAKKSSLIIDNDFTPVTYDPQYILQANHLKKYFPIKGGMVSKTVGYVKAVDGVTFNLKRGTTMGLVGESGCGKTTTGRTILRLYDEKSGGQVLFNGKEVYDLSPKEMRAMRTKMQIIFQDPFSSLSPRMPVGEIIGEAVREHNLVPKAEFDDYIDTVMENCGLQHFHRDRYPHEFSGGQRQRIGLARAMVMEPELVVADEPISALDVSIRAQVLNLLKKFQKERDITYLFIAHDLSIVRFISDRIGVIYKGDIVEIAEAEELFDFPLHPYTRSLISAIPIPDPILEKNKVLFTYDPSVHDYSEDKPELVDIGNNHFVYGNKKEIEEYKAIRAKGEKVKSITILDPDAPRPEQTEQKVDENGSDAFLETPLHDTGSKWYSILSFFLPILGLIAAGVFRHFHHIRNYKACKKGAIAGLITRAVIILFFALMLVFALL